MSYGTDQRWHCGCGAAGHQDCTCADKPVRQALLARLTACGVFLLPGAQALPVRTLAAVLVAVEDPYWAEGDSQRNEDADQMIHLIKRELRT